MSRQGLLRFAFVSCVLAALATAPSFAEFRLERELALGAGGEFVLDADVGSVTVHGTDAAVARVVVTSPKDDLESYLRFAFDAAPGRVEVRADKLHKTSGWFSRGGSFKVRFDVEVPQGANVRIDTAGGAIEVERIDGEVKLDTSGGRVTARSIGGPLEIDTSGGSIEIEEIRADADVSTSGGSITVTSVEGNLDAETSGGNVKIREVRGDVDAESSGGSIRIEGAGGRVSASTSGGSISVSLSAGNGRGGSVSTSGGGIRVTVPAGVGISLDAHTSGGTVQCELPVTVSGTQSKDTLRGDVAGGGERLRLRTSGGSIVIQEG